jgi:hypothetical protein
MTTQTTFRGRQLLFIFLSLFTFSLFYSQSLKAQQASKADAVLAVPAITLSATNVSCPDGNNGTITTTITSDDGPFSISWTGPGGFTSTTQNLTSLVAGTYTLTSCNNSGCATADITITQPDPFVVNLVGFNPNCSGGTNGFIATAVSGGTAPYTYLWSTGATTADLSDVAAGTYTLTVTDANGCTQTTSTTLTDPAPLVLNFTGTPASCTGGATGSATVSVTGGLPPFNYLWSNGATTSSITDVAAGTYSVTIGDERGCSASGSVTVTTTASFTINVTTTPATCAFANDGTASVSVTGGTAPFTYLWSTGETTAGITNLAAGSYTVTVTDATTCSQTETFDITQPTMIGITPMITPVTCNGGTDGAATIVVEGGVAPYTYLWSTGATTASVSGMAAGAYQVTVTDASGCSRNAEVNITEPPPIVLTFNSTVTGCTGTNTGTATVFVDGGTSGYTYLWSNGGTTATITGLAAGTYTVTVTDAVGCTQTGSVTVTGPVAIVITPAVTGVSCNGGNNGEISLSVTGGTPAYTYLWSNGATTSFISGLTAGTYTVTVTDEPGCTQTATITVTEPTVISLTLSSVSPSCNAGSNGSASVTATGGTPGYTYLWSNGASSATATGLTAGTYTVTVTDANGCTKSATVVLSEPTAITLTTTVTAVSCNGGNNGTASVTATGGTPGYTYLWSTGATTAGITGLVAGSYTVTVTDANGCVNSATITVGQPTVIILTLNSTPASCNGGTNGTVSVNATGGTPGYTYLWSNGATTATVSGLAAGTYSVTVTDANGCIKTGSATVSQPSAISLTTITSNVSCNGGNNGTASVTASGGTPGYTYLWSNGATTANVSGLAAGTYTVTVTDAGGCTQNTSVTITQPAAITVAMSFTPVNCNGGNNGTATATPSGGTPNYTFLWSNGATTSVVNNLVAGTYSVTVTDASGCTRTGSVTITQPPLIAVSFTTTAVSCFGGSNGAVSTNVTGGIPPYTYIWSTGATTPGINGLTAGPYTVTVRDANLCTFSGTATVTEPTAITITGTIIQPLCFGSCNGGIIQTISGGTAPYTYLWSNGGTTKDLGSLCAGTYSVTVRDANNCTATQSYTLINPTAVTVNLGPDKTLCLNQTHVADGTIAVPGTIYQWTSSNGFTATTPIVTLSQAGTYRLTVTTPAGCTGFDELVIATINTPISSDFVMATQAFKDEVVTLVNIANPRPDNTLWQIPVDPNISVRSTASVYAELVFTQTGTYFIGMRATLGACESVTTKKVIVLDPQVFPPPGRIQDPLIQLFSVAPNPSTGQFAVRVTLREPTAIRLRLINLVTNAVINDRSLSGSRDYTVPYSLVLATGVYLLSLETPTSSRVYKVMIN